MISGDVATSHSLRGWQQLPLSEIFMRTWKQQRGKVNLRQLNANDIRLSGGAITQMTPLLL